MANLDAPIGFRVAYTKTGAPARLTPYKSASATAIYPGDYVKSNGSGRVVTVTAVADNGIGVAASYVASSGGEVFVYDDLANTIFEAQIDDGSITDDTQIGNFFDIVIDTGDTVTLQSKHEVDGNSSADDNVLLVGLVNKPGNAWGAQANVYIQFIVDANAMKRTTT